MKKKKKTRDALHCHHYVCWLVPLWYTSLVVCLILSWFRAVEFYSHTTECIYWHWGNHTIVCVLSQYQWSNPIIWVGWWSPGIHRGCHMEPDILYQLIAKPGNKTTAPPSPDTYDMGKYITLIHIKCQYNHNKTKHNKAVCIFHGIYSTWLDKHPSKPANNHQYKITPITCGNMR